jgi:hypothetical protein
MTKLIVNCETGETTERQLNKAEKDQQKLDEAKNALLVEEAEAKEAARAAIFDRLGLTADEAAILLG